MVTDDSHQFVIGRADDRDALAGELGRRLRGAFARSVEQDGLKRRGVRRARRTRAASSRVSRLRTVPPFVNVTASSAAWCSCGSHTSDRSRSVASTPVS
jgi:hypothetical protein